MNDKLKHHENVIKKIEWGFMRTGMPLTHARKEAIYYGARHVCTIIGDIEAEHAAKLAKIQSIIDTCLAEFTYGGAWGGKDFEKKLQTAYILTKPEATDEASGPKQVSTLEMAEMAMCCAAKAIADFNSSLAIKYALVSPAFEYKDDDFNVKITSKITREKK